MKVPFYEPCVGDEEKRALIRVIDSKWLTQGPEVEAFEREAAVMLGAPQGHECVAVSSATAGLYLLLKARHGGEKVLVPTLTFAATINAAIAAGVEPVLADVDLNGLLKCEIPEDGMSWSAIMVNFAGVFGSTRDWKKLPLRLYWDQAHSFQPGAYKPNSVWSFYSNKNIGCGEGGLVGCDSELAEQIRAMRDHGRSDKYEVLWPGSLNFRMTELQAAVLREQLKKLPWIISQKRRVEGVYRERLDNIFELFLPPRGVTHLFWIEVKSDRDALREVLLDSGIETSVHYLPLHLMAAFKQYGNGKSFPVANVIARQTLSLPFWPGLSDDQVFYVCDRLKRLLNR